MNYVSFTFNVIRTRFTSRCVKIPLKHLSCKSGKKVLIGAVIVAPIIIAQNEVNNPSTEVDNTNNNPEDADSGWERLKAYFFPDEYGNLSKGLTATMQSTYVACTCGILFGGIKSAREALHDFMRRNEATMFESQLDAKRRLSNHVTINFAKGSFHWALRLSAYNFGFMLFITSLSAYRGSSSIIDYMIAGTVVGSVLRLRLGPPAAIVGGTVGFFLGCVCGVMTKGLLNLSNHTLDDITAFQYEIDNRRNMLFKEELKKAREDALGNDQSLALLKDREASKKEVNI